MNFHPNIYVDLRPNDEMNDYNDETFCVFDPYIWIGGHIWLAWSYLSLLYSWDQPFDNDDDDDQQQDYHQNIIIKIIITSIVKDFYQGGTLQYS